MSSLYVHIPFCNHICAYCDFPKVFYNEDWVDRYLEALKFEIKDKNIRESFDTIYIGGGTPSSLTLGQMEKLFRILKPLSQNVKEYSIEVNPESMDDDKIELMIKYGVNRLSIGIQTFNDDLLKTLDRHHTKMMSISLIEKALNKGIEDINIDLIYGLPNQTLEDVKNDIKVLSALDISHVSIYSLILEDNTMLKNNNYKTLDEDEDALWYDYISNELEKIGFIHYEVSNYYKKKPSMHNLVYWNYNDYEGIGLGSHSLKNGKRYENTRSLTRYLHSQYLMNEMIIDREDQEFEKIMMGLRLLRGINIEEVNSLYSISILEKYHLPISKYVNLGMMEIEDGYLRTTKEGIKFLNTILIDFL